MQLQGQEGADIVRCFISKDFTTFKTNGVIVEGNKYLFLKEEDKKIVYARRGGAITMQVSKTAVVIAHSDSQHGYCNKGVWDIAEYLDSMDM